MEGYSVRRGTDGQQDELLHSDVLLLREHAVGALGNARALAAPRHVRRYFRYPVGLQLQGSALLRSIGANVPPALDTHVHPVQLDRSAAVLPTVGTMLAQDEGEPLQCSNQLRCQC